MTVIRPASLPLLDGFDDPQRTFAWRRGRPIPVARFLADVRHVAALLPATGHVLNVCVDRYAFAVGLGAAIVRGQASLLPPSTHAATVRQLVARFPDAYCLAEAAQADIDLPQTIVDLDEAGPLDAALAIPDVATDLTVAYVFTSGSTGLPTMHRKRWGSLVENVRAEGERLGCDGRASAAASSASRSAAPSVASSAAPSAAPFATAPLAIVATVPPQHMYGFESSLLMAWQSGTALVAERPFFPADIVDALARIGGRRMLVTTPFHLRTLLAEGGDLPAIDRIVCATAPLSNALAHQAERCCGAPVLEIYGCTETGQLASRRPVSDARWQLFGRIDLTIDAAGRAIASDGHIDAPTPIGDLLELADDFATSRRFMLVGRSADLVNIAGRRTSLAHLTAQLQAIDGVVDGAFLMPEDDEAGRDGVTRLVALVVAPTLDAARLLTALRERIDPVFLPRPLHFVERLPRNATGKLTRAALDAIASTRTPPPADCTTPSAATPGRGLRR